MTILTQAASLTDLLIAANIPVNTVRQTGLALEIVYADEATQQQRDDGDAILAAFDPSDGAETVRQNLSFRTLAKEYLNSDGDAQFKLQRAVALITLDEVNVLRDWITAFKAATAAATSLADFKTRVAALDNLPERTTQQLLTAIENKIDDGSAD